MIYKQFGNSNVQIPVIVQGTTGAGSKKIATSESIKKRIDVLLYGIDLGMNMLDMSEGYEGGHTEEIVGKVIYKIRDKVFISTKFEPHNNTPSKILQSLEISLKRLKTDYIDLFQVHWPNPSIPVSDVLETLEKLKTQGKIRFSGVCNYDIFELKEAVNIDKYNLIQSIQVEYNLYNRRIEFDLLPYCNENDIIVFAYSVFNQGNLNINKYKALFHNIIDKYNVSLNQIILNWILTKKNMVAIVRSMNMNNTLLNAQACNFQMEHEEYALIDENFKSDPIMIDPNDIEVLDYDVDDQHVVYTTLEQAKQNRMDIKPSPQELAEEFLKGKDIRPIELKLAGPESRKKYYLLHGRIRYWGWMIAFNGLKSIPCIVINT